MGDAQTKSPFTKKPNKNAAPSVRNGEPCNKPNDGFKRKRTTNSQNKIEQPEESAPHTSQQQQKQQQQPSKNKMRKEVAIFGNYRSYYGYRVDQDLDEDPRLKVMKKEWFCGKDCLDIGCNVGLVTIAIAKKFGCRSMLGVDIDGARVEDANWMLRKVMRTDVPKGTSKVPKSTDVEPVSALKDNVNNSLSEDARDCCGNSPLFEAKELHKIVSFQKGNFVQNWYPPAYTNYHAILCLSVSKWIHLNWGDDGLITLFSKVWRLLKPGGVFILEPQPWSSYYNNRHVSETAAENYKKIQIPPEDFQDILLDKIGFREVENLTSGLCGTKLGFNRPILAFWK